MIIAVDFDQTITVGDYKFPSVGVPNVELINLLRDKKSKGARLILWTCRVGEDLNRALKYCEAVGLSFDAVNENLPDIIDFYGGDTRKIFADVYIEDKAVKPKDFVSRFKVNENPYGTVGCFK